MAVLKTIRLGLEEKSVKYLEVNKISFCHLIDLGMRKFIAEPQKKKNVALLKLRES